MILIVLHVIIVLITVYLDTSVKCKCVFLFLFLFTLKFVHFRVLIREICETRSPLLSTGVSWTRAGV